MMNVMNHHRADVDRDHPVIITLHFCFRFHRLFHVMMIIDGALIHRIQIHLVTNTRVIFI